MDQTDQTQEPAEVRQRLNQKLSRVLALPMAVASLLFLALFVASLALPGDSPHQEWLGPAITVIWALFVLEFAVRFAVAPECRVFLRRNWFDLLAVALPALRGLRAVRAFRALGGLGRLLASAGGVRLLSLSRVWLVVGRGSGGVRQFLRASRFATVLAVTVLVVVVAAAIVMRFEHHAAGANIGTFGDALWWSAALVTTVASDKNPVTGVGRVVAVLVMVYGMAVFGYFMSCAVVFIQGRRGSVASGASATPVQSAEARRSGVGGPNGPHTPGRPPHS